MAWASKPWIALLLSLRVLTLGLAGAHAQTDDDGRAEFEQGIVYFEAGEYEAAYILLEKAYTKSGRRPSTIFALAQCERALGRVDEAIAHFEEYLATDPEDRVEVENTIRMLKVVQEGQAEGRVDAPPATRKPLTGRAWFWVAMGAVAAGAATAVVLATQGTEPPYGGTTDVILTP